MEHKGLEERILHHDKQLVKVETILERVAENQDKMTDSINSIALSLTSLSNIKEANSESFKRVHKRIDNEIEVRNEKLKEVSSDLKELDLARTLSKYPKLAVALFVVGYLFTIYEFRSVLTGGAE